MSTDTLDRPETLDDMVGQAETINRLRIAMQGAAARQVKPPHVLLSGPPGHGKTTLARIVAREVGGTLVNATGPTLRKAGDLAGIVATMDGPSVLFIDEIHRLPTVVEEMLYEVLEDGTLTIVAGSGPSAKSVTLRLPPLLVVGATTAPGKLTTPLRDRFGLSLAVQPYSDDEIRQIVERSWSHALVDCAPGSAQVVAERSKGVPRLALHLAARVLDVAAIESTTVTPRLAERALEAFGVGRGGLDEVDCRIIHALTRTFAGRAVGLNALAQALDVDTTTIQNEHEPALVRAGLIVRTPAGRQATELAYAWQGRQL